MAWISLIIAGLLEPAWAAGLKSLGLRFSWPMALLTAAAMAGSLGGLYWAMARLPLGIAYPVWTGIGSVGAVLVSALVFGHSLSPLGWLGLALVVVGMSLLGTQTH
ncbi:MAG: DMT family transporter [Sulfitobacter sp.]